METKKNTITEEHIQTIMDQTEFEARTIGSKTTVVCATLPNGFVITESSSCVDPENYDSAIGQNICIERIKNKVRELEGYKLQDKIANESRRGNVQLGGGYKSFIGNQYRESEKPFPGKLTALQLLRRRVILLEKRWNDLLKEVRDE